MDHFCANCQKVTIHLQEVCQWLGNLKKIMVYLVCSECDQDNCRWLEDKEDIDGNL